MNNIKILTLSQEMLSLYSDDIIDILESDTIISNVWTHENIKIDLPGKWKYSNIAINKDNNKVQGFCICSRKGIGTVHIHKIYVHPLLLGQGVGKKLLQKTIDTSLNNNIQEISLFTFFSRETAYKWYLKLGFKVFKILDNNTRAFMKGNVNIINENLKFK